MNNISLDKIIETRAIIPVDKKKTTVNAICLEGLIITKYRAGRDSDQTDLSLIAVYCHKKINWKLLQTFTKDDIEFRQIAETEILQRKSTILISLIEPLVRLKNSMYFILECKAFDKKATSCIFEIYVR